MEKMRIKNKNLYIQSFGSVMVMTYVALDLILNL